MKKLLTGVLLLSVAAAGVVGISKIDAFAALRSFAPVPAYWQTGTTRDDLLAYKKAVEGKITRLSREAGADEEVVVTATFTKPLTEPDVLALVNRHNAKVHHITGRAIEQGSGLRATFSVAPASRNELFDRALLEAMLERNDADFKGFIEAVIYVPNRNLRALASDGVVFLADPSADEHLVSNPKKNFMPGVFWKLEDYGLVAP